MPPWCAWIWSARDDAHLSPVPAHAPAHAPVHAPACACSPAPAPRKKSLKAQAVVSGSSSGMKCPVGKASPLTLAAHCACHSAIGLNMRCTTPRWPHSTSVVQAM